MTQPPSDHWVTLHGLLAREVPEVAEGSVELRAVARVPGRRTKVAVSSLTPGLDPVGACVGPRASRIDAVRAALGGERIDVVPWSEETDRCIRLALAPARVQRVDVNRPRKRATAFVPADQSELARGDDGLNQRLASELTGWAIEISATDSA